MGARAEISQCLVTARRNRRKVAQPAEPHLARARGGLGFLVGVIGHEGGEPLGPVAAGVIHHHAIAPPVVQDLVPQRGRADEGQTQHLLADVGQRRHAETGRQRAGHHRELGERIGADERAVALDVALAVGKIRVGQARNLIERSGKVGAQPQRPTIGLHHATFAHHPRPGHQVDAVGRLIEGEARAVGIGRRCRQAFVLQPPRDQRTLAAPHAQAHAVGKQCRRARIPPCPGRQVTAIGRGHRRHALEHAAVVTLALERWQRPGVTQLQRRALRHLDPPGAPGVTLPRRAHAHRATVDARVLGLQRLVKHELEVALRRTKLRFDLEPPRLRIEDDIELQIRRRLHRTREHQHAQEHLHQTPAPKSQAVPAGAFGDHASWCFEQQCRAPHLNARPGSAPPSRSAPRRAAA